jgi:hypothetical protein
VVVAEAPAKQLRQLAFSGVSQAEVRPRCSSRPLAIPAPVDSDIAVEVLDVIAGGSGNLHYRKFTSENKPLYGRSRYSKVLRSTPNR